MSVQTFDNHSHRGFGSGLLALATSFFNGIFAARAAQARFNELWYLSDAELAAMGLQRENIAQEVMKVFDAG